MTEAERIEYRYRNAVAAENTRMDAARRLLDVEHDQRIVAILADRQRDFQVAGLNQSGTGPA